MQLKELGKLQSVLDGLKSVDNIAELSGSGLDYLRTSLRNLTAEEIIAKTATMGLSEEYQEQCVKMFAVDAANYKTATSTGVLAASQGTAAKTTTSLSLAMKGLWITLKPFLKIAAIAAAIGFVIHKIDESIVTAEEQAEANKELKSSYDDLVSEFDEVASRISTIKDRIQELEGLGTLSIVEKDELERLRQENKELEYRKTLLEADKNAKAAELNQGIDDWYEKEFQKESYKYLLANHEGEGFIDSETGSLYDVGYTEKTNGYTTKEAQFEAQLKRGKELVALGDERTLQQEEELRLIREATTATANELATKIEGYEAVTDEQKEQKKLWESYIADSAYIRDPGKYQQQKFDEIWNADYFTRYKSKITKSAKNGNLDIDNSILNGLQLLADGVGTSTDEIKEHIRSMFEETAKITSGKALSKTNMISEINGLSEGFESLDKIMESQKDDGTFNYALFDDQAFKDNFSSLGEAYTDFVETISDNPKDIKKCQDAYNNLVTEWIYSEEALSGISDETANVTRAMLENMGVANATEVVENALIRRKAQLAWESRESSEAIANEVIELCEGNETLDDSQKAWAAYSAQKLLDEVYNGNGDILQLKGVMQALGLGIEAWETYSMAKAKAMNSEGYWEYTEGTDGVDKKWVSAEENMAGWDALADYSYEQMNAKIEKLIRDTTTDVKFTGGPKTKDNDGGDKDKPETIDWIERKNKLLQEEHDWNKRIADDENKSYNQRISALNDIITADKERAQIARDSSNEYLEAWNEVSAKLKPADISRIMNGSLEIEDYSEEIYGKEYIDNLNKGIELWDKKVEYGRQADEIEEESIEHQREAIRLQEEIIKNQQEILQTKMDEVESEIELANVQGKYVGAGYYKDLISYSEDMTNSYEDQIANLREQLELVDDDSAEYYRLLGQIEDCEAAIADCTIQQAEWNETIERLPIERIQTYITLLQHTIEDLDNFTSNQSQLGISPTKDQYQTYIDLYTDQINELLKKQEKLVEMQKKYDYGSEKYKEYADEIQGIDNEISGLINKQLEYNDAILHIPINEMSKQYDNIAGAREALDREIAEDNAKGLKTTIDQYKQLNGITVQQLQLLTAQRQALVGLLSVYDEDSEKYKEVQSQIAGIDSTMSSLVQEQYNWNAEILNMPIEKLDKANENLSSYSSILGDVLSDYDAALEGVNVLIDQQIDGIQSQLDLLSESNEARKVQLSLEQALYNLRRAEEQKTTRVIRDGEIQYESNADDLRSAQQDLADAQYDKMVYDLEQQIDKLEDIKQKWADIVEEIENAKKLQAAEDFFGSLSWKEDILSDSQEMRDIFQKLYESTSAEKESVDKQIESNERISAMMGEFVARYQEGSITYDQALTNISGLISSMEGGLSAMEQLNGMMDLDNIASLGDIASSAEAGIADSAAMLGEYLTIVESNKESVEGFETVWSNMAGTIDESVAAFNEALNSIDSYLDVFNTNAEAINSNTSTWEEMKENIKAQVEALKAAAKALEEQQKSSSSKKPSGGSSSSSSSSGGGGSYIRVNGNDYSTSEGSAAEIFVKYGTDSEKQNYIDYREKIINDKADKSGDEGWREAAHAQLRKELEDAGVYHKGIKKGFVDSSSSSFERFIKSIAIDPLKSDEVLAKLQKGEGVFTPSQMENTVNNSMLMGKMLERNSGGINGISGGQTIDFSIGELHLHEVNNADDFANALDQTFELKFSQNFSKYFK